MTSNDIQNMTLRDKIRHASLLVRELTEHLEQGFIPKARDVVTLVRSRGDTGAFNMQDESMTDTTVRNSVADLLQSEAFTDELYGRVDELLSAIDSEVARIVGSN